MFVNIYEKRYGRRLALENIHLNFSKGKTALIIGTSGAGKSTMIKCIIGTTGFSGNIRDYDPEDIGYIPQFPMLNTMETVEDALYWSALFSRRYASKKDAHEAALAYIKMMGLSGEKRSKIKSLSGGQKQRVSIAKELIRKKDIIIADEIDTGLDAGVSHALIKTIADFTHKQNKTTIVISHNLSNMRLYDKIIILVKDSHGVGRVAYSGSADKMRDFFGVDEYSDILVKLNSPDEGGLGEADTYIRKYDRLKRGRVHNEKYH